MPQIDALRAICVFAVMYTHFLPQPYWIGGIYWGTLGVRCFFVISGFLITTILVQYFQKYEIKRAIKIFVLRRFARLFPLLLLTLTVTYLIGFEEVRRSFIWHITYLSNIYFVKLGRWDGAVSHLWTLSVEEQFYLLWPLILAVSFRKSLMPVVLLTIASCFVFRYWWGISGYGDIGWAILTPSSFDALGLGALLSLVNNKQKWRFVLPWIGMAGALLWFTADSFHLGSFGYLDIDSTGAALFFTWVVGRCATGISGPVGGILENTWLNHAGRVSYGIYLFHNFTPALVRRFAEEGTVHFALTAGIITYVLASVSFRYFETPFRRYLNERWDRSLDPLGGRLR